ncbi:hypothetical protein ACEPAF_7558 [Sanghuangporus sanghuang]
MFQVYSSTIPALFLHAVSLIGLVNVETVKPPFHPLRQTFSRHKFLRYSLFVLPILRRHNVQPPSFYSSS